MTKLDAERWSAENKWPYSPRPAGGFAESPAFRSRRPDGVAVIPVGVLAA